MLTDSFNRNHTYLRISLTDNCNLRCFYCMPEEDYEFTPASRLMQPHEIESIARVFVDNGVTKIRLTGGEPLVRKDAADIITRLSKLPVELTLTTNATRLHDFTETLKTANVKSLNISLDTLDSDKFKIITRRDGFQKVMDNIYLMIDRGFNVKINVVVMKGLNDQEIIQFVEWTKDLPVQVRFIEFMPFDGNRWTSNQVFTWQEIINRIEEKFTTIRLYDGVHDTDKKYRIEGHKGSFSVISTMSAPFCAGCNRMRLTADGKMKNCLFSDKETDLLGALRNSDDILPLIINSIHSKEKELGGQFTRDFEKIEPADLHNRSMISIGG